MSRIAFDWIFALLSLLFIGGVYVDGWAHNNLQTIDTFFTPWHAMLYGGFGLCSIFLTVSAWIGLRRGARWRDALPRGYHQSLIGVILFVIGGVADMFWHAAFGFESDIAALLSPTHLVLATAGVLIVAGPLRAAWFRIKRAPGWREFGPTIISMALLLAIGFFFTQFAHPLASTWAGIDHRPDIVDRGRLAGQAFGFAKETGQALGLSGMLLQTVFSMLLVLFAVRRWLTPTGTFAFVFGVTAVGMTFMRSHYLAAPEWSFIAAAAIAGLCADFLVRRLRPSIDNIVAARTFAFTVPAIWYALYFFVLLIAGGGMWWAVHVWAGIIVMSGLLGLLLSFLAFVPRPPLTSE